MSMRVEEMLMHAAPMYTMRMSDGTESRGVSNVGIDVVAISHSINHLVDCLAAHGIEAGKAQGKHPAIDGGTLQTFGRIS